MSPFQRISPLADCGNAFGRNAEPDRGAVRQHRPASSPCTATRSASGWAAGPRRRGSRRAVGLAEALLFDDEGPVGRALQTLLLRPAPSVSCAAATHLAATSSGPTTCSTTPTSRRRTPATGPAASSARRCSSCGRARPTEVAGALRPCADAGVPVVPQGGNTGLVGGSVPRRRADGRAVDDAG